VVAVRGRTWALLLAPALLAALAAETTRVGNLLGASKRLRAAEITSLHAGAAGARGAEILRANLVILRQAQRLDPAEVGVPMARGGVYFLLGQMEPAVAAYDDALALEKRPETYLNRGRALLELGRREIAEESFRLAVRLDPRLERFAPR
jgi:tetratricopeptide (TPR) repeat protein